MFYCNFASIVAILIFNWTTANKHSADEDPQIQLLKYILDRPQYEKVARPVRNGTGSVSVSIRMSLYQLIDIDEPKESIEVNVWMNQYWYDELLAWNPLDYANISWVVIPAKSIWVPDTTLYNGLSMHTEDTEKQVSMTVAMNMSKDPKRARVRLAYPAIYKFSCKINVRLFPFDQQICTLTWGSWVHDHTYIDYWPYRDQVHWEQLIPHAEWQLVNFTAERDLVMFSCCRNPYAMLKFHLVINRRPLYIVVNLVIPIVLIVLISVFGFFTPDSTERGRSEKVSLGINTLLAMSILLLTVADKMPTTATFIPLIGWFFLVMIGLVFVAILCTSAIIHIQRLGHDTHMRVSPHLRRILFTRIAKWVRIKVPHHLRYELTCIPLTSLQQLTLEEKLDTMRVVIERLSERRKYLKRESNADQSNTEDWEWVANVIERCCLAFFCGCVVCATTTVLLIGRLADK